jgi:hypothetical protein
MIVGVSKWQFSDELQAEVVLACKWTDSLTMDCPDVFGELLIVFNCSVLSFWIGNKDLS